VNTDDRTAFALWNLYRARDDRDEDGHELSPEAQATLCRLAAELKALRVALGFQPVDRALASKAVKGPSRPPPEVG
jgi:hypothetical protein